MIFNYTSEVDATQEGPACPQPVINNYPVHEDCLRLNVYRPDGKMYVFVAPYTISDPPTLSHCAKHAI